MGLKAVDGVYPNIKTLINGEPARAQMVVRRIPIKNIPVEDEEKCSKFLNKLYEEKVKIFDLLSRYS